MNIIPPTVNEPLTFLAAIPTTGNPITFSGGEGEAGAVKFEHYMTGAEVERLLSLRGKELMIVIQEA